ncbi:hypothetical protein AB1484_32060 [Parafrankia sp. FMc6]|uniref:hypothetical protein n=1 Tax=Parafrankia soli TaxID=2599596 RepID=UPI0034D40CBB
MTLLPAEVPSIPEARAEIVPARLARKVAPLFGVAWPGSPFGSRTWVSDFGRITLSEIARGAPLPLRSQAGALTAAVDTGWALVDRVGIVSRSAALPNEIANATLNRFGPDTRAAVVLTAVNRLLDPLRAGLEETIPLLVDDNGAPLPPGLRLAGWASVLVEVFRSQPALVVAGIHARAIQRPLTTTWDVPVGASAADEPLTRCEISGPRTAAAPSQPRELEIVDWTLRTLDVFGPTSANPVAREALSETVVGQLLYRLLDVGSLRDASHLWISARGPGQLALEALLTPGSIIDRFIRDALAAIRHDAALPTEGDDRLPARLSDHLPAIPTRGDIENLPLLARRTAAIALLGTIRQVLAPPADRERIRAATAERLEYLRALVEHALPSDDPVRAIVTCRIDLIQIQLLRHDSSRELANLTSRLDESTAHCERLFEAGVLDRGATAEIVSASNVELNALRTSNAMRPDGLLPAPDALDRRMRERWRHWLTMVEAAPGVVAGREPAAGQLGYHLHNYAAFLATHRPGQALDNVADVSAHNVADHVDESTEASPIDTTASGPAGPSPGGIEADLVQAVGLFRDVVLPARERFVARSGISDPLRNSLQMASAATSGLAEAAVARGDLRRARDWAALGYIWIIRALADQSTRSLIAEATESACRFALRAVPALVIAAELNVPSAVTSLDDAATLLDVARRWERSALSSADQYIRHDEIESWASRLAALRPCGATIGIPMVERVPSGIKG